MMIRKLVFGCRSGLAVRNSIVMVLVIFGVAASSLLSPVWAQSSPQPKTDELRVATRLITPFAMENSGRFTGFSMELWQKIAADLGKTYKIVVYPTLPEVLSAVQTQKVDVAIAAISITAEREQKLDFSYPMFNSGLQILVRSPKKSGFVPNLLRDLISPIFLQLFAVSLGMVVVAAHIIWLLERRHPKSAIDEAYFPGIFEAAWWAAATLATQAEEMPKGPLGRLMAVFWMFIAVVFVAYFTATVTTSMTVQTLQGDIKGLDDLQNRTVATTAGSTAAEFLRTKKIKTLEVDKIDSAYDALLKQQADAVVFDAPVLMYYASREGKGNVQLVGEMLRDESYGIAVANNSPYRKPINSALLRLRENGTYQAIYDEWFKSKPDNASN
jgi:polar amino acid transport system substrate-binding protein